MGQYLPLDSVVHRLDARSKIAAVAGLGISIFIASDWLGLIPVLLLCLLLAALSGLSFRSYFNGMGFLLVLVSITALLQMVIIPGQIWLHLGWVNITREGLNSGSQLLLRLTGIIFLAVWLTATTRPAEMTAALERIMRPLAQLKLPVHELVMIMTLSMRFIPLLVDETVRVQRAQLVRGADWSRGNLRQRGQRITSLIVPVLRLSLERAAELAAAMENRGYHGGQGMTSLSSPSLHRNDWLLLIVTGLVLVGQVLR